MSARRLFTILSFITMVGASCWVVSRRWPEGGLPLLPWPAHAAAATIALFELVTRALKIQLSARSVGSPLRFGTALRVCLAGDFAAGVTPARSGAEPARFLVLAEAGLQTARRVLVLFLELFLEMCSLVVVCALLALLFRGRGASVGGLASLVGGYSVAVLGVGAIGLLLARNNAHGPPPMWIRMLRLNAGHWRTLQRQLRQLRASVAALRGARATPMLLAWCASVLHVAAKVAILPALVFLGDPAFSPTMDRLAPLVLWPLALFYGGVVVPAPGGGGVIEGAFAFTLADAIPAGLFAAALLWWRFYTYYVYLLVGGVAAGDAIRRALRSRGSMHASPHATTLSST